MKKIIFLFLLFILNGVLILTAQNIKKLPFYWEALPSNVPPFKHGVCKSPFELYSDTIDNVLYIGGKMTTNIVNPTDIYKLLKWDGKAIDSMFTRDDENNSLTCIKRYNNKLYLTGSFYKIGTFIHKHYAIWDGAKLDSFDIEPDNNNFTMFEYNNELYFGGLFDSIGNIHSPGVAKWDGINWHGFGSGIIPTNGNPPYVYALIYYNGKLYAGGNFSGGVTCEHDDIAAFNNDMWYTPSGWNTSPYGTIYSMIIYKNELYVGGEFKKADGALGNNIVKWNDTAWSDIGGGMDGPIADMVVFKNELYVVGGFTTAGGIPATCIAKWDGEKWCSLGVYEFKPSGSITDIAVYNNEIYISGGFTTINSDTINNIARWTGGDYVDTCGVIGGNEELKTKNEEWIVYPNPCNNKINIQIYNNPILYYTICNHLGQIVKSIALQDKAIYNTEIDVSSLPVGLYLMSVLTEDSCCQTKFIKE